MRYTDLPYAEITEAAYRLLLSQSQGTLPIEPLSLQVPSVLILSYREWALRAGLPLSQLELASQDGYTCLGLAQGLTIILYNDLQPYARARFTLFHELGHHLLDHRTHGDAQELEANFFAGQCIAPTALLLELRRRGYVPDEEFLRNTFDISFAAAQRKCSYLSRFPAGHPGPLDARLVAHYAPYLKEYFPDVRTAQNTWALDTYET